MHVSSEERNWAIFIHLSCYLSMFTLGIGLIGPLVLWLIKRSESDFIDEHGCTAVNYHLSMLIYSLVAMVVVGLITVVTLGVGMIVMLPFLIVVPFIVLIVTIWCSVKASIAANDGYVYDYPFTITFVRPRFQTRGSYENY